MTMADTIAVMRAGHVEQLGSPEELYEQPRTEFVANFLGQSNLLDGTVQSRDGDHAVVDVHNTSVRVPAGGLPASGTVRIGVRPEKVDLVQANGDGGQPDGRNALTGTVVDSSFIGVSIQYVVRTAWDDELMVFVQNRASAHTIAPGNAVTMRWEPEQTFVLETAA
jgi:spermidine/putrescine transport system ATP-binding protein